jgi:hypothetical protein
MRHSKVIATLIPLAAVVLAGPAQAQWKYGRPAAPWEAIPQWEKQGFPAMEGQWQYECKNAKLASSQFDSGGRYLAVYNYNPTWIYAQCFAKKIIETKADPHPGYYLDPDVPVNYFKNSPRNLPSQKAEYPWVPLPSLGSFALKNSGFCMDIPNGRLAEGAPVQVFACQGSPNQKMRLSVNQRGQIVAMPGTNGERGYPMCFDYWPGQGLAGDPIKIYTCHQLSTAQPDTQVWWPVGYTQLRANNTGRCIGAANPGGTGPLVLKDCTFEGPNPTPYDWVQR